MRRVVGTREGGIGPLSTTLFYSHAAMYFVNRELSPLLSSREILGNPCWDFIFFLRRTPIEIESVTVVGLIGKCFSANL